MVSRSSNVCVTLWETKCYYAAEKQKSALQADKDTVNLIRLNFTWNQMLIR